MEVRVYLPYPPETAEFLAKTITRAGRADFRVTPFAIGAYAREALC